MKRFHVPHAVSTAIGIGAIIILIGYAAGDPSLWFTHPAEVLPRAGERAHAAYLWMAGGSQP